MFPGLQMKLRHQDWTLVSMVRPRSLDKSYPCIEFNKNRGVLHSRCASEAEQKSTSEEEYEDLESEEFLKNPEVTSEPRSGSVESFRVQIPGRFKDDQGILRRQPSIRSSRISVSSLVDSNLRGSVEFEGTADEKLSAEEGIFESI
jgi:hypothetical protein